MQEGAKAIAKNKESCEDNVADEWRASIEAELRALTKFRHPNLVQLMGYCSNPAVIVYEYLPRGSLYDNIHEKKPCPINWTERELALHDTCKGLVYLHCGSPPIVHQDIKSQNILLDSHGHAKIGDFGFSVELPKQRDGKSMFTSKMFARTEGYFAPEIASGKYSHRSDVYSYGVVALETFSGLKAYDTGREDERLVEHCEESLLSQEQFCALADKRTKRRCPQLLRGKLFRIITRSLSKHSKRPSSTEILSIWA
jgi:serine/threonine protein kinase